MIPAAHLKYLQDRIARFGDQAAYKALFLSLYSSLFSLARSIVKEKQAAEEIVSDVFVKIWERRQHLEKIENLKVYLFVSTRNTAINYLDHQKRHAIHSIEELHSEFTSLYFDPEQLMITADMLASIQKAIDELPPKCKLIFKLAKEEGLKYAEVAEIVGVSAKTVENQLAIAVKKIGTAIQFNIHKAIPSIARSSRH